MSNFLLFLVENYQTELCINVLKTIFESGLSREVLSLKGVPVGKERGSPSPSEVTELVGVYSPEVETNVADDVIEDSDRLGNRSKRVILTEVLRLNDSVEVVTTNGGVRLLSCELEVSGDSVALGGNGALTVVENRHERVSVVSCR